ncbi:hypothetical protein K466DRAFT_663670 [Polyporus arcularius HHB13444]|uniref:Uncharacterized protein n=1 Tax=Polyporus arcularius HHB13444 TaxID=1314778 RepID=A0A5C3PA18_9APHY|nr:hypothetical protein K466DRAFT_663670 [Polyporus arcularius HHB13444]
MSLVSELSHFMPPPQQLEDWLPRCKITWTLLSPSLPYMPTPPIPEELRDHCKVLYGFKIMEAHISRYLEEERIENVPEDAVSRRRYKSALLRSVADELEMGFLTQYHMALQTGRPSDRPDEDMVYWAYGSFGYSYYPKIPSAEILKVFMSKLHIHDVSPAWY